jgi:hypothetical protein
MTKRRNTRRRFSKKNKKSKKRKTKKIRRKKIGGAQLSISPKTRTRIGNFVDVDEQLQGKVDALRAHSTYWTERRHHPKLKEIEFEDKSAFTEGYKSILVGKIPSARATCEIQMNNGSKNTPISLAYINLGSLKNKNLCKQFFRETLNKFFQRFPTANKYNSFKINSGGEDQSRCRALNCYNSVLKEFGYNHTMDYDGIINHEYATKLTPNDDDGSCEAGFRYWIRDT